MRRRKLLFRVTTYLLILIRKEKLLFRVRRRNFCSDLTSRITKLNYRIAKSCLKYSLGAYFHWQHCVKSFQICSFFWSAFSGNPTEKTPYLDTFHTVQTEVSGDHKEHASREYNINPAKYSQNNQPDAEASNTETRGTTPKKGNVTYITR